MHPTERAERAASYLVDHARRISGVKLCQGAWDGTFAEHAAQLGAGLPSGCASLKFITERRIRAVPRRAISGLFAWANGADVELREDVPSAEDVLGLQARGRRCVSLLPEGISASPHANGLEFLIHDLCHLDKFVDPEHHDEQVGFFATLLTLGAQSNFHALERQLDGAWVEDRNRLASDVNGSAVYLFALLKMKLKMAARRRSARLRDVPTKMSGPLDEAEQAVFHELESALYDCLGFRGELERAARTTSARRDATDAAAAVAREFRRRGREALTAPTPTGNDGRSVLARAS